jgi:hypothetical protein
LIKFTSDGTTEHDSSLCRRYAEGKGSLPAGHDSASFFKMLIRSLHREIAAVTAAHLAAAQQIDLQRSSAPSKEALAGILAEYQRAHKRTMLTLQV